MKDAMNMNTSDSRADTGRRGALPSDVGVFIEAHLRELARAGRLDELARSRDALMKYYRAQKNDAAVHILAGAPEFSLALTPGGGVTLTLDGGADHATWTQSDLLQEEQDETNEVESRAIELAGGPDQFRALSDVQQEALTAQAVEEVFKRLRSR